MSGGSRSKSTKRPKSSARKPGSPKRHAGKGQATCKDAIPKDLMVYCEHKVGDSKDKRFFDPSSRTLQVVQTDSEDTVTIYCEQPSLPGSLVLKRNGKEIGTIAGKSMSRGKEYSFGAQYYPASDPYKLENAVKTILTKRMPPTQYTVEGLQSGTITVEAYMPDQWQVSISLPPFDSIKTGRVLDNSTETKVQVQGNTVVKSKTVEASKGYKFERSGWSQKTEVEMTADYKAHCVQIATPNLYAYAAKESWKFSSESKTEDVSGSDIAVDTLKSIQIQRNGAPITVDLVQIIMSTIAVAQSIYDIYKLVSDNAPKIGWFASVEIAVLQGSLELAWGWREHSDHRVFYYTALGAKVELFKVGMVLGFGLDSDSVKAQVCAEITGTVTLEVGVETNGPEAGNKAVNIGTFKAAIEGGFYARVVVGAFVNAEAGAKTSVEGDVKLGYDFTEGMSLAGNLQWTGIVAVFKVSVMFGMASTNKEYAIADPQPLPLFEWPKKTPEKPRDFTQYEIQKAIKDELEEGWEVRFFDKIKSIEVKKSWIGTEYHEETVEDVQIDTNTVASEVARKIWKKRQKISLDHKTIEGICHTLRKKMDQLGSRWLQRDWVDYKDFLKYVEGSEFATVLDQAIDPGKTYLKKSK